MSSVTISAADLWPLLKRKYQRAWEKYCERQGYDPVERYQELLDGEV